MHPIDVATNNPYYRASKGQKYIVATEPKPANKVFIPIVNPFVEKNDLLDNHL